MSWLRNVSISQKLYFVLGIMGALIAIELTMLYFTMVTLSSVRAIVGGEGLWSKAQKDAAFYLERYGRTHDERDYQKYLTFLTVSLGDHKARLEIAKGQGIDVAAARAGFIEGRNHPADVDRMISFFQRFNSISYVREAVGYWIQGDAGLDELRATGVALHTEITSKHPSQQKIAELLNTMDQLDAKLTHIEDSFSYTLGEGSRWLEGLVLKILFAVALTVEISGIVLTFSVSRGISKGLGRLARGAEQVAEGDLSVRVEPQSGDEIGRLTNTFNQMADALAHGQAELQRAEEVVRAANTDLERRVAERTADLERANKELEAFSYSVSHDLRAPLRTIDGFSQSLAEDCGDSLDAKARHYIERIRAGSQHMGELIEGLLALARVTREDLRMEPVDLTRMARTVVEDLRRLEPGRSVEFSAADGLRAWGDRRLLDVMLRNLLENAWKFSANRSPARLEFDKISDNGNNVFFVRDNGAGFDMAYANKLFGVFARLHRASEFTGAGVGLATVQRIVERHGGKIWANAEVGRGATFFFTLPSEPKVAAPERKSAAAAS